MSEPARCPSRFDFMQRAFLVTALVALPMALLSCFLVLRGWSLMGDAISHAVLPGIVVAYWLGAPLALGAFAAGMLCAGATGFVKENSRVKEDTAMGIVFSGMFALGIVLYVWTPDRRASRPHPVRRPARGQLGRRRPERRASRCR